MSNNANSLAKDQLVKWFDNYGNDDTEVDVDFNPVNDFTKSFDLDNNDTIVRIKFGNNINFDDKGLKDLIRNAIRQLTTVQPSNVNIYGGSRNKMITDKHEYYVVF